MTAGWTALSDRVCAGLLVLAMVLTSVVSLPTIIRSWQIDPVTTCAVLLLIVGSRTAVLAGVMRRWTGAGPQILAVLGVGAVVAVAMSSSTFSAVDCWVPALEVVIVGCYLLREHHCRPIAVLIAVAAAVAVNLVHAADFGISVQVQVVGALQNAASMLLGGSVMWLLTQFAREQDCADQRRQVDEKAILVADTEQRRLREVQRFVHDELLHTLRVITLDRSDADAAVCRARATLTRDRLAASRSTVRPNVGDSVRDAVHGTDPAVSVIVTGDHTAAVPADLATSMSSAARELVTNSIRHSGADRVTVAVQTQRSPRSVTVTVTDDGRGFDPADIRGDARGLSDSVAGRLQDACGWAEVSSRPGVGTTVRLVWQASDPELPGSSASYLPDPVVQRVLWPAVIFPAANVPCVIAVMSGLAHPVAALVAAVGLLGVVVVMLLRPTLVRRSVVVGLVAMVAGVCATATAGWAVPIGSGSAVQFSTAAAAVVPAAVVTALHRRTAGLVGAIAVWVTAAGFVVGRMTGWSGLIGMPGIVGGAVMGALFGYVANVMVGRLRRQQLISHDWARRRHRARMATTELGAAVLRYLDEESCAAVDLIDKVANGLADPGAPQVRSAAAAYELALRDRLQLTAVPATRRAVEHLRASGWSCVVRLPAGLPESLDLVIPEVLREAAARHGQLASPTATLTARPADHGWRVSLMVGVIGDPCHDQISRTVGAEPGALLPAPSGA